MRAPYARAHTAAKRFSEMNTSLSKTIHLASRTAATVKSETEGRHDAHLAAAALPARL
jgi:hypothetical protein